MPTLVYIIKAPVFRDFIQLYLPPYYFAKYSFTTIDMGYILTKGLI